MIQKNTIKLSNPNFQRWNFTEQISYLTCVIDGEIPIQTIGNVTIDEWTLQSRYANILDYTSLLKKPKTKIELNMANQCITTIKEKIRGSLGEKLEKEESALTYNHIAQTIYNIDSIVSNYHKTQFDSFTKKNKQIERTRMLSNLLRKDMFSGIYLNSCTTIH